MVSIKDRALYLYRISVKGYYTEYGQGMKVMPNVTSYFYNLTPLDPKDKAEGA